MGALQTTELCDEGGRPGGSVAGEGYEHGATLGYFGTEGAELTLLVLELDLGEGYSFYLTGSEAIGLGGLPSSPSKSYGAKGRLLQQRGVGSIGVEGFVSCPYSCEGTIITGAIDREVRPALVALKESEVRSRTPRVTLDIAIGERFLELGGKGVNGAQGRGL